MGALVRIFRITSKPEVAFSEARELLLYFLRVKNYKPEWVRTAAMKFMHRQLRRQVQQAFREKVLLTALAEEQDAASVTEVSSECTPVANNDEILLSSLPPASNGTIENPDITTSSVTFSEAARNINIDSNTQTERSSATAAVQTTSAESRSTYVQSSTSSATKSTVTDEHSDAENLEPRRIANCSTTMIEGPASPSPSATQSVQATQSHDEQCSTLIPMSCESEPADLGLNMNSPQRAQQLLRICENLAIAAARSAEAHPGTQQQIAESKLGMLVEQMLQTHEWLRQAITTVTQNNVQHVTNNNYYSHQEDNRQVTNTWQADNRSVTYQSDNSTSVVDNRMLTNNDNRTVSITNTVNNNVVAESEDDTRMMICDCAMLLEDASVSVNERWSNNFNPHEQRISIPVELVNLIVRRTGVTPEVAAAALIVLGSVDLAIAHIREQLQRNQELPRVMLPREKGSASPTP